MSNDAQNYTEGRYDIMGVNKKGVHRKYKFEIIEHPVFGEIRTAVIKGKRYYSSYDISKMLNLSSPSDGAAKHLKSETPAQYIIYQTTYKNHSTLLRMIPIDEALLLISSIRTERASKIFKWLLSTISDQFNYD